VPTAVVAWTATSAVCVAAALFGQTARASRRGRRRPRSARSRLGLFVSLSGPWLAYAAGLAVAAVTGGWTTAAAATACAVVLTALLGLALRPR
jgi:hypothetical protein